MRRTGPNNKLVTELVTEPSNDIRSLANERAAEARIGQPDEGYAVIQPIPCHQPPPGDSKAQRDAERVMLDLLGQSLAVRLEPATIPLASGARVEIDGADEEQTMLVECWAHQGPPKPAQKNKVLADALKLTWIAQTMYPRPRLILCMSDSAAAAPFQSPSRSCGAQALQDIGIEVSLVDLPDDVRAAVGEAQIRQHR